MKENEIYQSYNDLLVKIGEREWLEKFTENGEVYMPLLRSFRKNENKGIGDPKEGRFVKINDATVYIDEKPCAAKCDAEVSMGLNYPVFCCSYLKNADKHNARAILNKKMVSEFSKARKEPALVIFSKTKFMDSLKKACNGILQVGYVKYCDNIFLTDYFCKHREYEYQQEFRFVYPKECAEDKIITVESFASSNQIISLKGYKSGDLIIEHKIFS